MHQTLITAGELAGATAGVALFDCRFDLARPTWGEAAYAEAHLPGAQYLHLDRDLSAAITPSSGRHPLPSPEEFALRLGRWGVDADTQVVVYDQGNGMYAARAWWMLRWLGHRAVAVLDGGFAAWSQSGYSLSQETMPPRPARNYLARRSGGGTLSVQQLQQQLGDQRIVLVDGRGADRFAGQNETIDPVAGHVPGAVNHPFTRNLDAQGRFLPAPELRERWLATLAGRAPTELVAMCGSGVSACHNLLALEHAGFEGVRLYPGSWSEWIRDPTRPVATGPG